MSCLLRKKLVGGVSRLVSYFFAPPLTDKMAIAFGEDLDRLFF